MDFTLRNCTLKDLDFILNLKELGMKWYIEKLYGWNAEIQKAKTLEELNKYLNDMKIIMIDNNDAGITTFSEFDDYFQVGLTIIPPDYQNKGIATKIISKYIDIARKKQKRIIIKTFKENPAQRLYQRLGFKIYETTDSHLLLEIKF